MKVNRQRLEERFLRYVALHTTAEPQTNDYPSSPGQRGLGQLLAEELRNMGLADVVHNQHGLVLATVPAAAAHDTPVMALNAHLDTSPEAPGHDVRPQVIRQYAGGDIVLPGDPQQIIRVSENPELSELEGCTLITTDGTTLLGGDDKAGVAIIMEAAQLLTEHDSAPHGPLRVLFTCDEEIGRGVDHVDLRELGADVCYTLDGQGANAIDVETFSADLAVVTFRGVNIHPAIAKDRMVNAIRAAGCFVAQLPHAQLSPETTAGRDGFLHPYQLSGQDDLVQLRVLLRDFDTSRLRDHAERLRAIACHVREQFPRVSIDLEVTPQYRNLGDGLAKEPRAVEFACRAHERLGRTPRREIIRGGTDGSRLTELGLPTPNLSSGQHNPHSRLEWVCLDEMVAAVEVVLELAAVWAESGRATVRP